METSLLCLMAKCKNHFLFFPFHFRTINFVINASKAFSADKFCLLSSSLRDVTTLMEVYH
jgi:hypothetical protein